MTSLKVMLAKEYELGFTIKKDTSKYSTPPVGWIMSEKFDGYRALFRYEMIDGQLVGVFYSRNGKRFNAPDWFLESMPPPELLGDKILDGELWAGRDNFQLMGIVRKKVPIPEEWLKIQYQVYDITNGEGGFVERLKQLQRIVNFTSKSWTLRLKKEEFYIPDDSKIDPPLVFAEQKRITSEKVMKEFYQNIIDNGGEGIMMKHPSAPYDNGRSSYMLKFKPAFDREAVIIDYKMGDPDSKYNGMLGSFICRPLKNHDTYMSVDQDDEHIFTLSGMDDTIRKNYKRTHPVGTIITFECSGFTDKGVPRFGRYLRKRDDVVVKDYVVNEDCREMLDKVIKVFNYLEKYYKSNSDTFRAKTYMSVNKALKGLSNDSELDAKNLKSVKGIGQGTIDRIKEIVDTGTLQEYEKVKDKKSPLEDFLKIHGVGKQHAKKLFSAGFKTIDDLRKCESIKDYLNDTQMKGLKYYEDMQVRIPYEEIQKHEMYLKDTLHRVDPRAELTIAGSYRRKRPDSGDIDLLLKASNKNTYEKFVDVLTGEGYLTCMLARGPKKYMGMGKIDMSPCHRRIDIMYTKPEEYPFAILYFTGSGEFNVRMRDDSLKQGYTMNEYGIKHTDTGLKVEQVFSDEKDIFKLLGYEYLEPEDRI
jgi:DNA polymerase beta